MRVAEAVKIPFTFFTVVLHLDHVLMIRTLPFWFFFVFLVFQNTPGDVTVKWLLIFLRLRSDIFDCLLTTSASLSIRRLVVKLAKRTTPNPQKIILLTDWLRDRLLRYYLHFNVLWLLYDLLRTICPVKVFTEFSQAFSPYLLIHWFVFLLEMVYTVALLIQAFVEMQSVKSCLAHIAPEKEDIVPLVLLLKFTYAKVFRSHSSLSFCLFALMAVFACLRLGWTRTLCVLLLHFKLSEHFFLSKPAYFSPFFVLLLTESIELWDISWLKLWKTRIVKNTLINFFE